MMDFYDSLLDQNRKVEVLTIGNSALEILEAEVKGGIKTPLPDNSFQVIMRLKFPNLRKIVSVSLSFGIPFLLYIVADILQLYPFKLIWILKLKDEFSPELRQDELSDDDGMSDYASSLSGGEIGDSSGMDDD